MKHVERNPRMVEEMNKAKQRLPKLYDEACGNLETPPALLKSLCWNYIRFLEDSEAPDMEEIIRAGEKSLSALESTVDSIFHPHNQPLPKASEEKILDCISVFASILSYLSVECRTYGAMNCKMNLVNRHRKILEKWFFALSEYSSHVSVFNYVRLLNLMSDLELKLLTFDHL